MDKREGEERPDRQPLPDSQDTVPPGPGKSGKDDHDGMSPGRPRNPEIANKMVW